MSSATMHETHHFDYFLKTVMLGLGSWFLFVCSDTISKWLLQDYSVSQVIFISQGIGALVAGIYILLRNGPKGFIPQNPKWHVLRCITVGGGTFFVVHALKHIPLADFYGIVFLSPLLLCLLSHFLLKERIGKHRMTAILVGFVGVLVLAGPQFTNGNVGYILALCAVLFSAFGGITVRKIGREKNLMLFAFFPFLTNTIIHGPLMAMDPATVMPTLDAFALLLLLPPIIMAGLIMNSVAFARAPETSMIAPFHYSQMIWGVLLGYVLFHEVPSLQTAIGASIIIGAGLYMIWREHVLHKAAVIRNLQR